jgi:hypothetical protein
MAFGILSILYGSAVPGNQDLSQLVSADDG